MCGISGELRLDGGLPDPDAAVRMRDRLAHRGPDDAGLYQDDAIALGNRRLSVRDLSPLGHLPMQDGAGGSVLAYNGELYNARELREELEARGERFRSTGDAEVVLKLLAREGEAALPRLRGMFALAHWDPKRRRLILARDPFGIKPLYFRRDAQRLLFASELKSLLEHPAVDARLSPRGVSHYFAFGHVGSGTIYQGVEKLPAGHVLMLEGGAGAPRPYWDTLDEIDSPAAEQRPLLEVLGDSVARHLVADVPVGLFLSGGLDSSAIAALATRAGAKELRTFCVGYEGREALDELPGARRIAQVFGTRHQELILGEKQFAEEIPFLAGHFDEPCGDAAAFPTLALARFARRDVTVVLTGDGGDELLGGYPRYAAEGLRPWLPAPLRGAIGLVDNARIRRAMRILGAASPVERIIAWQQVFQPLELGALLLPEWEASPAELTEPYQRVRDRAGERLSGPELLMYIDQKTKLSDGYCERVDRATMAVGLEARTPFLDVEVARRAMRLPRRDKVRGFQLKTGLRRALAGILPAEILELPKRGFTVPIPDWLRGGLRPLLRDVLAPGAIRRRGILKPESVATLLKHFEEGTQPVAEQLWLVFAFELWGQAHLDRSRSDPRSVETCKEKLP